MSQILDFVVSVVESLVSATTLKFENVSTTLKALQQAIVINIDYDTTVLRFAEDQSVLNFELREYDSFNPKYKIVMDFMEDYTYADIFWPNRSMVPTVTVDILDPDPPQIAEFENEPDDTTKPSIDIII